MYKIDSQLYILQCGDNRNLLLLTGKLFYCLYLVSHKKLQVEILAFKRHFTFMGNF